ncbi:16S rRNA-processing protein RimM [Candidatus Termititenax aidoneus]|uniref:Ribosome maturation factor RimM n=1 Tax=Termititenax aidoneus TaxID=2218524 RepID=A0A388TD52_TERA1|nr:16S rRNA-processing protein RimM [Candidatus Termititenax aidoneus]
MYFLGVITGARGLKGELKLNCPYSDFDFSKIPRIRIGGEEYTLLGARPHKANILLKLAEITSLTAAEKLRGQKAESAVKPQDKILYEDVWQKKVYDQNENFVGSVTDVLQTPAHDVLVITADTSTPFGCAQGKPLSVRKEILVPLIPNFVKEISAIIKVDLSALAEG